MRGLYVDRFIVYTNTVTWPIDSAESILGNPVREDSLLNYCMTNNVTFISLYNLYPAIAGNTVYQNATYRDYLSCFIVKAKTQYCIKEVGAAGSSNNFFTQVDTIFTVRITPPIRYNMRTL
jgi:hypothetical protein